MASTNVPDEVRAIWTDVYKLFDQHFKMDTGSPEAWDSFWNDVSALWKKHGKKDAVASLLNSVADLLIEFNKKPK